MQTPANDSSTKNDIEVTRTYAEEEFALETLGLLPLDIADKLYNSHNIIFYRLLDGLGEHLEATCQLDPVKKKELMSKILPRYVTAVEVALDKNFSLFQQYFTDTILEIPADPKVAPAHYKGLDMEITDEHMEEVDRALEKARNEVIGQRAFNHWITREEKRLDQQLQTQKEHLKQLSFITATMKKHNVPDLDGSLQKIKSQYDELDVRMRRRMDEVVRASLLDDGDTYTLDTTEYIHKYLIHDSTNKPLQ
ncbi:hypothetical protein [Absidia glauca]|uniref:Uncharacterized protein n=1 Tax=Absidia glauca TaxID=4829 RepID=A0A168MB11_ABSGL|nr:hypothetical protein [Absidia glauca]